MPSYRKGDFCPWLPTKFCQDGDCDGCDIYRIHKDGKDPRKVISGRMGGDPGP